jgi:uncharacterized protein
MPANLSPEYKAAQAALRQARDPNERLHCLREMLRVIPKHKGTDHLQADIKRRIHELVEELERPKKGGARGGPALVVRPEGAAQIALLGPPNAGKSALHSRLTGSNAHAAAYPFTTQFPEPGMMPHEDVHFQLVDLPAVSPQHPTPWLASALQTADACLLVVDLSDPDCVGEIETVHDMMRERGVTLAEHWEGVEAASADAADDDPFALSLRTLLLANKADAVVDAATELRTLVELVSLHYPALAVSAISGRDWMKWAPGSSSISASSVSTPRRRASLQSALDRMRCVADRRWRMLPAWSTRIWHGPSSTHGCGERPASKASR